MISSGLMLGPCDWSFGRRPGISTLGPPLEPPGLPKFPPPPPPSPSTALKLSAPTGGPLSTEEAPGGGGGSAGGFGAIESGSAAAGARPALNSQSAAPVAAQARTTWRQDQRIEAVLLHFDPIGRLVACQASPVRRGRPLLSRQDADDQILARQQARGCSINVARLIRRQLHGVGATRLRPVDNLCTQAGQESSDVARGRARLER